MSTSTVQKLYGVVIEAIEYIGSANYPGREEEAKRAVRQAFIAAIKEDEKNVIFFIPPEEE